MVTTKLNFDVPGIPKGGEVQIMGLGTFKNGETYEISEEQQDSFRRANGRVVEERNDNHEVVGSKLQLGPTLRQAEKSMNGVTVVDDKAKVTAKTEDDDNEGDES